MNAGSEGVTWTLPGDGRYARWSVRVDTSALVQNLEGKWLESSCEVKARSMMLLQAELKP
jgi:hypothetical protein